jgi:hypothetical protein
MFVILLSGAKFMSKNYREYPKAKPLTKKYLLIRFINLVIGLHGKATEKARNFYLNFG